MLIGFVCFTFRKQTHSNQQSDHIPYFGHSPGYYPVRVPATGTAAFTWIDPVSAHLSQTFTRYVIFFIDPANPNKFFCVVHPFLFSSSTLTWIQSGELLLWCSHGFILRVPPLVHGLLPSLGLPWVFCHRVLYSPGYYPLSPCFGLTRTPYFPDAIRSRLTHVEESFPP